MTRLLTTQIKKIIFTCTAAVTLSTAAPIAQAQEEPAPNIFGGYLAQIAQYTYGTLQAVNNLPTYMQSLAGFMFAWLAPDNSETTANLQNKFQTLANANLTATSAQNNLQPQLMSDFFGSSINARNLPNANDLTYQTLLGQLYFNPDPRSNATPALNYLRNASALRITHPLPAANWRGSKYNQQKYISFYNAISAVQTYNIYLMSQMYSEYLNGNAVSQTERTLIQQASSSDWFAQVATESIGIVLRQILMYNSQIYVTLVKMLQTQKQMLTAQAMTNTLLIISSQGTETILVKQATGEMPG